MYNSFRIISTLIVKLALVLQENEFCIKLKGALIS